jgi:uncharacterized membrane protein YadS
MRQYVPWFIIGFIALAGIRSTGVISPGSAGIFKSVSTWLTVAAMAALGLGVDLKALARVGLAVVVTVSTSLLILLALSFGLIKLLSIQ